MVRRSRGALEDAVLNAVQAAGSPVSVAQVVERLDDDPAYTTVMTTLARLWSKGALVREPAGRGYTYAPAAAPDEVVSAQAARSMRRLLDGEGSRADILTRFVSELEPGDEQILLDVLRRTTASENPRSAT